MLMNSVEESDPVEGYNTESGKKVTANKMKRKKRQGTSEPKTNDEEVEGKCEDKREDEGQNVKTTSEVSDVAKSRYGGHLQGGTKATPFRGTRGR